MKEDGRWYRRYDKPVRALVYANGEDAGHDEPMGLYIQDGVCNLTAMATKPPVEVHDAPSANLAGVSTPPTPPMQD